MEDRDPTHPWGETAAAGLGRLTGFLASLGDFDDEDAALPELLARIRELLDADAAALIEGNQPHAVAGRPIEDLAEAGIAALAHGAQSEVELPGAGWANAIVVPVSADGWRALALVRAGDTFSESETGLIHGLGRVVGLGLRMLRSVSLERGLREDSDTQAAENARLLGALRERQTMLERLSEIQRAIVDQRPLHEIFDRVASAACELTGDEISVVRLKQDSGHPVIAASNGLSREYLAQARRESPGGLSARAVVEGRTLIVDADPDRVPEPTPEGWRDEGVCAAMATPAYERGEPKGSVLIASRDPRRIFHARDRQALLALAEHVSLALNHARAIDEVAHEAFHDALTGLANRALFLDRVSQSLSRTGRSGRPVGILVVDIDNFKTLNDSLGHSTGDLLLGQFAERLQGSVRPSDTVGRLGGDEFAVLLDEIGEAGDAARAAERILASLDVPIAASGRELFVSASIGIAVGSSDAETLLRDADLAMARAKREGKGRYEAFEERMHTEVVERLELEVDLARALADEELTLDFQPIMDLRTGEVRGLESLVRWDHPGYGVVGPDRFIPLAESSGRIHELGQWVLGEACRRAAGWRAAHPGTPLIVGVNVSAAQLRTQDLIGYVADALAESGLPAECLTLEITETAVMDDLAIAARRLQDLKSLGVDIAIDDFGIGHSSLRYLQALPLDNLKIAKPFVDEINRPDPEPAILRAMLDLSEVFGLRPVAEGIERPEQVERLMALGCTLGQGHLLSRPMPPGQIDAFLAGSGDPGAK